MKLTQRQRVLMYLEDFGSITSWQAYADLGITQLGARIKELKDSGYKFKTVQEKSQNRYGDPVYFVRYSLEER